MEERVLRALESFETSTHPEIKDLTKHLATDAKIRIQGGRKAGQVPVVACSVIHDSDVDAGLSDVASNCCGLESIPGIGEDFLHVLTSPAVQKEDKSVIGSSAIVQEGKETDEPARVRTFLLADAVSGLRFVVPSDRSGGRAFNDTRVWCYRRGRFCEKGEEPDANFVWSDELQEAYEIALANQEESGKSESDV